jgi:hypothetical protein
MTRDEIVSTCRAPALVREVAGSVVLIDRARTASLTARLGALGSRRLMHRTGGRAQP